MAWSAAARLIFARGSWKLGDDLPKGPLMKAFGFFVGLLSTLMGIGGGLFANLLMAFHGRPIHQAVATSAALAVLISIRCAFSDQPAYRGARRAGCARAVEAHARTCISVAIR